MKDSESKEPVTSKLDAPEEELAQESGLGTDDTGSPDEEQEQDIGKKPASGRRQLTFTLQRNVLVLSILLALSLVGNGALGWLWHQSERSEHDARAGLFTMQDAASARQHAEEVALNYAMGAADMDYKDLPAWTKRLTANTTPELAQKLQEASASMEQIIVPLQWVSTPTPITAAVRSEHDGVFVVNAFVSVMTKNAQAPNGIASTATYTVTINKNDNWIITEVGGVDSALKQGR